MAEPTAAPLAAAQAEVAELLSDLIRIDTTNTGDTATSAGERAAAEWVACKLADACWYLVSPVTTPANSASVRTALRAAACGSRARSSVSIPIVGISARGSAGSRTFTRSWA